MKELKYLVLGLMIFLCTGFVSFADEKLDDPQNLYWADNYSSQAMVFFDPVEGAAVYVVTIYRDGEVCVPEYEYDYFPFNDGAIGSSFSRHFEESGSYTFSVQAKKIAAYIDSEFDSEVVMCPEPYEYVRPDEALENPQNLRWSNEKTGVVMWDMEKEYARYVVMLFLDGKPKSGYTGTFVRKGTTGSCDFSSSFKEEGEYTFAVLALSSSIETVAHSQFSYCDDVFDLTGHNLDIRNEVEKLVKASASNAREALEEIGADNLAIAMQSDSATRESIKAIEKKYNSEMGITVKKNVDAELGIDSDSISIVGAGLNVASGSNAVVKFDVPEEEVVVKYESFSSVLQMDISIDGTESNELAVPISLEMKIPASIDVHSMVILHYYQDGSFETIPFHVISREADGTLIRFTVTSFSPYVFAVESDDNGDNGNGDNGNGDNGNGNNGNGNNGDGDNGNGDNGDGDNGNGDNGNGDNGNGDNGNGGNGDNGNGNNGNGSSGGSGSSKKSSSTSTAKKSTWQKEQSSWKYTKASGKYAKSEWLKINGSWYWFTDAEVMATGWTYWNENWYYLSQEADAREGAMNNGWVFDSAYDGWFFLDEEGRLLTGWQQIEDKWYYFNPISDGTKGKMAIDSYVDSFYVNASGELEER